MARYRLILYNWALLSARFSFIVCMIRLHCLLDSGESSGSRFLKNTSASSGQTEET